MDDSAFADQIAECIARIDAGEDVDSVVAQYPPSANDLKPLLRVALSLRESAPRALPSEDESLERIGDRLFGPAGP